MMRKLLVFVVLASLLPACASQTSPTAIPTATEFACQPSEIQLSANSFAEIKGTMKSDGELWALLFFDKARVNEDAKIVWRITGEEGEFQSQAENDAGTILSPIWVEQHEGSNWERPGAEWGTGFNFPEPGCWRITVTRGDTIGEIALDVIDP
jgi:hypothetical protein